MSGTEAACRDDLGEMDGIGYRPLPVFLPPPDRFVRREDAVKVTLALSRASVDLFRDEARRQRYPTRGRSARWSTSMCSGMGDVPTRE